MGMIDAGIQTQLKKGQGETNERLDQIAKLLQDQNAWLAQLVQQATTPGT
jgi:hypothetical protein